MSQKKNPTEKYVSQEDHFESLVRQFRYAASTPCVFTDKEFQGLSDEFVKLIKDMTRFSIKQTHKEDPSDRNYIVEPDGTLLTIYNNCFGDSSDIGLEH